MLFSRGGECVEDERVLLRQKEPLTVIQIVFDSIIRATTTRIIGSPFIDIQGLRA
jgi:hypothetical protein